MGQIIRHFDMPQRFQGKNVSPLDTHAVWGNFFEIRDTVYYINHYKRPDTSAYFIFRLKDNDLIPIDSFSVDFKKLPYAITIRPQVVVFRDTAYINTKSDLYRWEPASKKEFRDTTLNTNDSVIGALALTPAGRPITAFHPGWFATKMDTGWRYDSAAFGKGDYGPGRVVRILYYHDTMLIQTYTDAYFIKNWTKVDSLQAVFPYSKNGKAWNNPTSLAIHDKTIFYNHTFFELVERRNGVPIAHDYHKPYGIRFCRTMVWHHGVLMATRSRDFLNIPYRLHYYAHSRWLPLSEDSVNHIQKLGKDLYVDGPKPGILADLAFVTGQIRIDDGNCVKDTVDVPTFTKIEVEGKKEVFYSNNGVFSFSGEVDSTYIIRPKLHYLAKRFICGPDSALVKIVKSDSSYSVDFAMEYDKNVSDLEIGVGSSPAIRGRYALGSIRIKNNNHHFFPKVKVRLNYSSNIGHLSSQTTFKGKPGDIVFHIDSIDGFEDRVINFRYFVDSVNFKTGDYIELVASSLEKDSFSDNDRDTIKKLVLRPYDPNMKESFPSGPIKHKVKKIDYTIQFQNVGSAPAKNVRVIDTMEVNMPVEYIRIKGTSHPKSYKLTVKDNLLIWNFYGINLPDSASDEEGSRGFVSYEAKVTSGLNAPGDSLRNRAFIYFDYEDPIETNTAAVYVTEDVNNTVTDFQSLSAGLSAYPNPFTNSLTVRNISNKNQTVRLYDVQGQVVSKFDLLSDEKTVISTQWLTPGMYFLQTDIGKGLKVLRLNDIH
ncbi:MAG: T9SS type A sorting domain-containing protein [Bacteroidia bacterium]|nr:T9SS type A sorting domain-containing protein [Bacteroidia bacterium]